MPPSKDKYADPANQSSQSDAQAPASQHRAENGGEGRADLGVSDSGSADELALTNDRLLRLQAEMQNLRNRTSREIADERRYAAMPMLRDLLPVVDTIDRAIESAEKAGEAENLLAGFRLVKQQLHALLTRHQCEPIVAESQPFDPHFHEAILQQPSANVPAGNVMQVTQPGYKLHDRVVRPAQVIVSSGAPAG